MGCPPAASVPMRHKGSRTWQEQVRCGCLPLIFRLGKSHCAGLIVHVEPVIIFVRFLSVGTFAGTLVPFCCFFFLFLLRPEPGPLRAPGGAVFPIVVALVVFMLGHGNTISFFVSIWVNRMLVSLFYNRMNSQAVILNLEKFGSKSTVGLSWPPDRRATLPRTD